MSVMDSLESHQGIRALDVTFPTLATDNVHSAFRVECFMHISNFKPKRKWKIYEEFETKDLI